MRAIISAFPGVNFINYHSMPLSMAFSKSFPKRTDKSVYPKWDEIVLTEDEEHAAEQAARLENIKLMSECLHDAAKILAAEHLKDYQTDLVHVAIALFEKRASHSIYWKENMARDKFDEKERQDEN
jgi:hypothetical protein